MAGYEIAYVGDLGDDLTGQMIVYLASGSNPITSEAWETYTPPASYSLNTPRAIVFSELHVLGSPYVPTGELTYETTSDGYTWQSVAALQRSIYPYVPITVNGQTLSPQQVAYSITTPPAGVVLVDSNDKNHENIYYGISGVNATESHIQYFISDPWGNTYILKSVNAENSTPDLVAKAVNDAVLPPGWTKLTPIFFQEDTTFSPSYSGLNDSIAHANEFRDSADSAWMQTTWSPSGQTLNAVAAGGLPIWAGPSGGLLLGSINDDVIYGAQGNDIITGKEGNDLIEGGSGNDYILGNEGNDTISGGVGNDTIDGGLGYDSARYDANKSTIIRASQNASGEVTIKTEFGTDTLINVEEVSFADGDLSIDELLANYAPRNYKTNEGNITASNYSGAASALHVEMLGSDSSDLMIGATSNDFINFFG
jgi:Ca2+-binding RTX toxin-like protein